MPPPIPKKTREIEHHTPAPPKPEHNQKFRMEIRHFLTEQEHLLLGKGTSRSDFCNDAAKLYHRSLPSLHTVFTHYCGNWVLCCPMAENKPWEIHPCTLNLLPNLSLGGLSPTVSPPGSEDLSCHIAELPPIPSSTKTSAAGMSKYTTSTLHEWSKKKKTTGF